jgi:Bacterial aa3 type cytochrome c oxidase subunit IV
MSDINLDENSILATHAHTFHRFMLGVKWFCIHLAALLSFLVISFCTGAGWGLGIGAAVVVVAVGVYAMNHGLARSTENGSIPRS